MNPQTLSSNANLLLEHQSIKKKSLSNIVVCHQETVLHCAIQGNRRASGYQMDSGSAARNSAVRLRHKFEVRQRVSSYCVPAKVASNQPEEHLR